MGKRSAPGPTHDPVPGALNELNRRVFELEQRVEKAKPAEMPELAEQLTDLADEVKRLWESLKDFDELDKMPKTGPVEGWVGKIVDFYDPRGADGLRPRAAIVVGECSAPGLVHLRVFGNPDVDHQRPESWIERNVPFVAAPPPDRAASVAFCCPNGYPYGLALAGPGERPSLDPGSGV